MSARVGLIVPSSNPTIEGFLQRTPAAVLLGLDVLVTRVRVRRIAADADADAQFDAEALAAAAGLLADAEVSLVSWAGTSGCWLGGDREDGVLARVSRAAGVRVVSSRMAMLAAMAEDPGAPAGVLTPYLRGVHDLVEATMRDAGHPVVAGRELGIERNLDFAAVPAAAIEGELRRLAGQGARSLALVCTNMAGVLPGLAGEPWVVVDSVLATLWHVARECGSYAGTYEQCYRAVCAELAQAARAGEPR